MDTAEQIAYDVVIAGVAIAIVAFVVKLLTMPGTAYKVAGLLLLILILWWLLLKNGEAVILGGLQYADQALTNWAKGGNK
jgi:uncharacterized membrane protein